MVKLFALAVLTAIEMINMNGLCIGFLSSSRIVITRKREILKSSVILNCVDWQKSFKSKNDGKWKQKIETSVVGLSEFIFVVVIVIVVVVVVLATVVAAAAAVVCLQITVIDAPHKTAVVYCVDEEFKNGFILGNAC